MALSLFDMHKDEISTRVCPGYEGMSGVRGHVRGTKGGPGYEGIRVCPGYEGMSGVRREVRGTRV